ncbi:glycerate dehydrogenase [Thioalkalivibrio versutus]|uniref:Glycerate dehydrogenase n=1 Tax=Thioalkalivibrio versutus TaxID=106634 RepID=A0A0G3GA72_9GAMM|nr:D-2-hydroxyacid dehydrogenase [Thioalkalivibrio versutus]AKJ96452.1 glycerate dehydrogenase [Thioalkalivibrio versutus]
MSHLQRGVFLDLATVDRDDLDLTELRASLPVWSFHEHTEPDQRLGRIGDAEVIVTNKVELNAEVLTAAPRLRLVCAAATGTNNIDVEAARRLGIVVSNARDYATDSVVQHVFALLLTLVTQLDAYRADIRAGRWSASDQFCLLDHPIGTVAGMRLGIIGWGVLGRATARVAEAFGMEVLVAESLNPDRAAQEDRVPLERLLGQCDVISLHCPLTATTRHLIDDAALRQMRPGALLLNTARGGLVDPEALARYLRSGHLGGAGIDVLEPEPPPADHPLLADDIPNLILTPHTAWAARTARQRVIDEVTANIHGYASDQPRNVVE